MKRNCFVKTPSHLCERRRKVRLRLRHFFSPASRGAIFSPFFPPPLPLLPLLFVFPHPQSGATTIYFTSGLLYDCGRFAFMLDGLLKKISDKAMNTLSGCSPLLPPLGWTEMLESTHPARSTAVLVVHKVQQLQL